MKDSERTLRSHYRQKQLNHNWRSDHEIVTFNNNFFEIIKQNQTEHIRSIYTDHKQQLPDSKPKSGGYVAIELIEAENTEQYTRLRLEKIKSQVNRLVEKGFKQKDICVLTRTNKYAIEVASYLIENGYRVVSSESLLLLNAPEVRLIIAFYYLIRYQTEPLYLADVISNMLIISENEKAFHTTFSKANKAMKDGLDEVFVCLSVPLKNNEIAELPVYELAEYLIRKLGLNKSVNIYLQYFLDFVFNAQQNGIASITAFLDLWELKKNKTFITMPEQDNAIRVMTVHKAKGLKFESVIADLINRSNRKNKTEFWTDLNEPGIEELKIGLLPISKELEKIDQNDVYLAEDEKTSLDFLNLIYVAFTRPVKALFINGHIKSGKGSDAFTKHLIHYLTTVQLFEESKNCRIKSNW
jgi:ATP-dependent exoDNAse (exonuclease V) beta subunit